MIASGQRWAPSPVGLSDVGGKVGWRELPERCEQRPEGPNKLCAAGGVLVEVLSGQR